METKDWIYSIALILTFGVSVVSLIINIKNRKNAIREHLYREQMVFFLEIRKLFTDLKEKINREYVQLEPEDWFLDEIYKVKMLLDMKSFLIENRIISIINEAIIETEAYFGSAHSNKGIEDKDEIAFLEAVSAMDNEIREFLTIDALTQENKKVSKNIFSRNR